MDRDISSIMQSRLREAFAASGDAIDRRFLYRVSLAGHEPTGAAVHYRDGAALQKPASLEIAQYDGDDGYYLLYRDDRDALLTDTYHSHIDGAFEQAAFEFRVARSEWTPM